MDFCYPETMVLVSPAVLEEGTDEILEYDVSMYQTQEVKELG